MKKIREDVREKISDTLLLTTSLAHKNKNVCYTRGRDRWMMCEHHNEHRSCLSREVRRLIN